MTWIRMECDAPDDEVFDRLGEALGVSTGEAFYHYFALVSKLAKMDTGGRLSTLLDRTLEQWAKWHGTPGGFAGVFRGFFADSETGELKGFRRRNEKLLSKQAADRQKRKKLPDFHQPPENPPKTPEGFSQKPPKNPRANVYGNGNQEQQHPPLPPPRAAPDGASVGVSVVEVGTHNGKGHHGNALVRRGREAVLERGRHALAEVVALAQQQARADDLREQMVAFVFAYWQAKHNHPNALQDRKRETLLRTRLRENRNDVSELLYAADGARKDRNLMGENDRGRKYDGIETIYRDRAQVERLASIAGYQPGLTHPQLAAAQGGAN